jgi:hypothetical protein
VAWIEARTTESGKVRYRVYWRDPSGKTHGKVFARKRDAEAHGRQVMVLTAAGGTLTMSQSAPGVLMGDLFAGPNTHTGNGPYAITEGTGIFAGATGHGHVTGTATNAGGTPITTITFELVGSLAVP